jgi:hypothetical protein
MILIARSDFYGPSMGHLRRFLITDKSYFSCPNLDSEIEIIITRVLLTGKSYYEDRVGARPVHLYVVRLLQAINTRMEGRLPLAIGHEHFEPLIRDDVKSGRMTKCTPRAL